MITNMEQFKRDIKSLSGIWASDDVYFSQQRDWYYADYKPAYPERSRDDISIGRSADPGTRYAKHVVIAGLSDGMITRNFTNFSELKKEIREAREAEAKEMLAARASAAKGPMEELCEVSPGVIELCTFPDKDEDYCKSFRVPKEWLLDILDRMDSLNEQKGVDLENFLNEYIWDETYFIYERAKAANKLLSEEEEKQYVNT